jgi:plastocyanin
MMWRLLICSSLLITPFWAATVRGEIAITDPAHRTSKQIDKSGIVIWLEPLSGTQPLPKAEPLRLQMVQKNKTFSPHIMAIPLGSTVEFPNSDPIFHNAFSNYNGQIFDLALYPPGTSRKVTFEREGIVRVFCNIHSSMSAVIVVLRTPFYAVSNRDGSFEIDQVPEGSYRLGVYYERATEQTLAALHRTVEVDSGSKDLGEIAISESGYLPIPHLNKYGKKYSTAPDPGAYPGARP